MEFDCEAALDWLAEQGTGQSEGGIEEAANHAAHVATCADCKDALQRYEAFSEGCGQTLSYEVSPVSEDQFLVAVVESSAWEGSYDPTVSEAVAEAFSHTPSDVSEASFLAAAAQQMAPSRTPAGPSWRPLLAIAAAALLALGLWGVSLLSSQTVPVESRSVEQLAVQSSTAISIEDRQGQVLVNGLPMTQDSLSLSAGARLQTAADSQLRFEDPANAAITVEPETVLELTAWSRESTQLALREGTIEADVVHREADERFEVLTANARVVVIGTTFSVSYTEHGGTVVKGSSGKVRVEDSAGKLMGFVTAGGMLRVDRQAPVVPEAVVAVVAKAPAAPPEAATPELPAMQRARRMLMSGQEREAIALLLETPATDWQRDALLGDAYQLVGEYEASQQAYQAAIERSGSAPASLLADLARLEETHLGDEPAAAKTWRSYLEVNAAGPDAPHAYLVVARDTLAAQRNTEAEGYLGSLLEKFPDSAQSTEAMLLLGGQLLQQQRWEDADKLFSPFANGTSAKAEAALVGLIRVRIAQGEADQAEELIEDYWLGFPKASRSAEVKRLEQALSANE